jgi:hypothetical protein
MNAAAIARLLLASGFACCVAGVSQAQQGIRHDPDSWRGSGLHVDPALGWGARFELLRSARYELAPRYSLLGAASESVRYGPGYRLQWAYDFGRRGSVGLSLASGREAEDFLGQEHAPARRLSLYGRYWFAPDWALSAEALTPAGSPWRRPTLRLGVQRQF